MNDRRLDNRLRLIGGSKLPMVALFLFLLLIAGAILLAARFAASLNGPPNSYYQYQVQRWEELLASKPDDPAVWATLGGLYAAQGDEKKADDAFDRALALDNTNAAALVHEAKRQRAAGDADSARKMLKEAAGGMPEGGRFLVLFEVGELESSVGATDAAIAAYEDSYKDNPTFWNAPMRLAFLYRDTGQRGKALEAARTAIRFAPEDRELVEMVSSLEKSAVKAPKSIKEGRP